PARLLHLEPMPVALQPPLEQEVRLILLPRDKPDDFLVQPFGGRLGLDGSNETVLVLALGDFLDSGVGGHTAPPATRTAAACLSGLKLPIGGVGRIMSVSDRLSSAPRIARLMFCQLLRKGQRDSKPHCPGTSVPHSVTAIGPSSAAITCATEISAGSRAKL